MAEIFTPVALKPAVTFAVADIRHLREGRSIEFQYAPSAEESVLAELGGLTRLLSDMFAEAAALAEAGAVLSLEQESISDEWLRLSLRIPGAGQVQLQERLGGLSHAAESLGAEAGVHDEGWWVELRRARQETLRVDEKPAPHGLTVLYVEDNPSNRRLVATVLRKTPEWNLRVAADGIHGLAEARRLRPDVILSDINIPGMDGYELLKELRKLPETAAIPVVAISAEAQPQDMRRALAAGFSDYLCKPFKPGDLVAALCAALAKTRSADAG